MADLGVVERYDRTEANGAVRRFHQEDLCQALSFPPRKKYETDGGPGATATANLLRAHASEQSLWRFVEAVAFTYLVPMRIPHRS